MLSICIPVYNSDVTELVNSLLNQIKELDSVVEICLIDDASTNPKCDVFSFNFFNVSCIKNSENVGRAKVRNQFLELANQSYLLFIDGDSRIIRSDFLKTYCDILKCSKVAVLCGASVYQKDKPDRSHYLRWKYSTARESKSLKERQINPNLGFKTNNFIIHREIFNRIKFNESIVGYGHEDSLFGFELKKSNICIEHVENPVLNHHLDENATYLKKTEEGVRNLKHVLQIVNFDMQFIKLNKLSRIYILLEKSRLRGLIYGFISIINPLNTYFLTKGYFVLLMFDLYKLRLMFQKK
jgi:glycosyltransferase involved in cell wall biosynthesis